MCARGSGMVAMVVAVRVAMRMSVILRMGVALAMLMMMVVAAAAGGRLLRRLRGVMPAAARFALGMPVGRVIVILLRHAVLLIPP